MHVIIRFADESTEAAALGKLIGRFPFKTWDTGQTMVPKKALAYLAYEGVSFMVDGPAK